MRTTLLFLSSVLAGCEAAPAPKPVEARGVGLLQGHPRAERIIERFGGAETYEAIQAAASVVATRLGKRKDGTTYDTATIADYPETAKGKPADAETVWRLKHALVAPRGGLKTCVPLYGVRLAFNGPKGSVDVLLCFECNLLGVFRDGKRVGAGAFDVGRPELVYIAKQLFPDDELIQKMGE
jgi:hypothetical protein